MDRELIQRFLEKNAQTPKNIHVLGDCILDEFYSGKMARINPESPNSRVIHSTTDKPYKKLPGGAASVAHKLLKFNTDVTLVGFIGDDLRRACKTAELLSSPFDPVQKRFCHSMELVSSLDDMIKNPVKKRFYDDCVQIGDRWDIEKPFYGLLGQPIVDIHLKWIYEDYQKLQKPDVVILSDYNKGFWENNPFFFHKFDVPVIVDPKKEPIIRWKNCTIFKPNRKEAEELSGCKEPRSQCEYFMANLDCEAVVITDAGNGFYGMTRQDFFIHKDKKHVDVVSVSGAGDCFIGVLALAYAHGFSVLESSIIAFEAGRTFVQSTSGELDLEKFYPPSKFIQPEKLKQRDFNLVMASGCFDILHIGHIDLLKKAKNRGDKLVVAVNSDASVKRLKGSSRPINNLCDRMSMLAALECVDYVVSFEENTPVEIIKKIAPDLLIKGEDWKDKNIVESQFVKVAFVPLIEGKSTTGLLESLL